MISQWKNMKLQSFNKKMKNNWKKLTDEEVALYQVNPDVFFEIIKQKYSMFRDDAERRISQFK